MTRESEFFAAVAARQVVRPRVAAIVVHDERVLVQRPADNPAACYAFVGGEYEVGDTMESRLRAEFEQETTARVVHMTYLFVVENRFVHDGHYVHGLEHYFLATLDTPHVEAREPHHSFHWLPLASLGSADLRPQVVRDAVRSGTWLEVRHLMTPPPTTR